MRIHKIFMVAIGIIAMLSVGKPVFAEGLNADKSFSVSPLNPKTNQPQNSYYDLKVAPNEKKTLKVQIYNNAQQPIKVNIAANSGTTNDNGITSYLDNKKRDSSLKISFSDIAKVTDQVVVIPKKSSRVVAINLTMPEKNFAGIILGGIRVTSADNKLTAKGAVTNNIAYTIGVVLRENDQVFTPKMNLRGVKTEQRNYRNYISTNLQNAAPCLINELFVKAQVTKKGDSKVLYEAANSNMRMAPNSNFNYGISLNDQPFKAGKYTMKISGSADKQPFSFEKDFTIEEKEAEDWNKNAVHVENDQKLNWWVYLGILLILISIVILIYYILKLKRERCR